MLVLSTILAVEDTKMHETNSPQGVYNFIRKGVKN